MRTSRRRAVWLDRISIHAIALAAVLFAVVPTAAASTIVAVYDWNYVVVAAESLLTGANAGKQFPVGLKCKIAVVNGAVTAATGLSEVRGSFDVLDIAVDILRRRSSVRGATAEIGKTMVPRLTEWLTGLTRQDSRSLVLELERGASLEILVAGFDDPKGPDVIWLTFQPYVAQMDIPAMTGTVIYRWFPTQNCPPGCPRPGPHLITMGVKSAIEKYVDDWKAGRVKPPQMNQDQFARFFVDLEKRGGAPTVGGPVNLVRLEHSGYFWEHPPIKMCPDQR